MFICLIREPQEKNPSVVMQALKLGFARRVLAERRRHSHRSQANLFEHAAQHVWQKRFYDFNVWTACKRVEKLRYIHRNTSAAWSGGVAGTVALEQFPRLLLWRSRAGSGKQMRRPQNEDTSARSLRAKSIVAWCGQATSRKPREVAHPSFFGQQNQDGHKLYCPGEGAHRPRLRKKSPIKEKHASGAKALTIFNRVRHD
jgi:hypothetical protein